MENLCVPRDQPEKEREGEGERERVDTGGRPSLCKKHNFIFKSCLYTLSFTQWKIQSHAGAAVLTLIDTRLSFYISFHIQKVSGDLHYLLAKRTINTLWLSSLVNVNLISPEVFFFNLHHP